MVFQNPALFPQLSVFENIGLGLKLRKVPAAEIRHRVTETIEMLGLTSCLSKRPRQLSGGEQQRVALARAIVRRPRLFLLDEPLSSLDPPLRAQMRAEIARIQRQIGITMIFVTHDQVDALTLGNRIAVLREGRLQQVAPPSALYAAPANRFVAGFIGFPPMSFLTGTIREASNGIVFQLGKSDTGHTWQVPIPKPHSPKLLAQLKREVILGVRPEDVETVATAEGQGAAIPATVEWIEALGGENIIHFRAHENLLSMRSFIARAPLPKIGEKVMLTIRMERVSYFEPETGVALR